MAIARSRLLIPLAVAVGGLVVIGAVWFGAQTQVRFALWQSVAERPLTSGEGRRLARCDRTPGWWTWVKVLHNDRPVPCGEGWAIDRMADKIRRSEDRRRWVRQYVETPDVPPARRLRASLLLTVVGEATPEEPAWLADTDDAMLTPEEGPERIHAEAWPWSVHLGPRLTALGAVRGMTVAGYSAAEVVAPYEAVWALDDPGLHRAVVGWVADGLAVSPSLSEDRWYRRRQGRPSANLPRGWSRVVLGRPPTCDRDAVVPSEDCLLLWRDLLVFEASESSYDPFESPTLPPALPELLPVLEPMGRRTRAVEWWMQAAEDWIRAAPAPERRLLSLAGGAPRGDVSSEAEEPRREEGPDGGAHAELDAAEPGVAADPTRGRSLRGRRAHPLAVLSDRAGTPFVTATVIHELGRRTEHPVEVRVDEAGAVWLRAGDEVATRSRCGSLAPAAPTSPAWSAAELTAAALLEAAAEAPDEMVAIRLRSAAYTLAPRVAPRPGLPATANSEVAVAHAAGQRLLPREAPLLAPPQREASAQIGTPCPG